MPCGLTRGKDARQRRILAPHLFISLDAWIRKNAKAAAGPTQIPLEGVNKAPEPLVLPAATLKRTWNVTTEGGKHLANVQATDAEAARAYAYSTFGVSKDERLIVTRTRIPR